MPYCTPLAASFKLTAYHYWFEQVRGQVFVYRKVPVLLLWWCWASQWTPLTTIDQMCVFAEQGKPTTTAFRAAAKGRTRASLNMIAGLASAQVLADLSRCWSFDLASEAEGGSGFIFSALLTPTSRVEDQFEFRRMSANSTWAFPEMSLKLTLFSIEHHWLLPRPNAWSHHGCLLSHKKLQPQSQTKILIKKKLISSHLSLSCMFSTLWLTLCVAANVTRLGIGAPVPAKGEGYGSSNLHQSPHKEDMLRRRLLGRNNYSGQNGKKAGTQARSNGPLTTKNSLHAVPDGTESEEELGRTAFNGKNTRPIRDRSSAETELAPAQTVVAESSKARPKPASAASPKKRPSSYLDEVLLARSEKRKKKKKPGAVRPTP
jgi:hypothetical protein